MTRGLMFAVLTLVVSPGCSDPDCPRGSSLAAAPAWRAVVSGQLEAYHEEGLPAVAEDSLEQILELLDLASSGETGRRRAMRTLEQFEAPLLTAAMLTLVEGRVAEAAQKTEAYAWLRQHGTEAMVPRLTLRLKYEKDWAANVDIAVGLLRFGCGAGLEPLVTILRTEQGVPGLERARWAAVSALSSLPPAPEWNPGESFDGDWRRLLEVELLWRRDHVLPGFDETSHPSRALRAELWKTIARFRSQPLRPVGDARYVLVRLPSWVFAPLCRTTFDQDRYVREHALQCLAWIGRPAGDWSTRSGFDLPGTLSPLLADGRQRARVLEAMGASGLASMQEAILPWLRAGNLEESTAAADALLRCADARVVRPLQALLASDAPLGPEGRYSLECLLASLDPQHVLMVPKGLDPSEKARRDRWAAQR